MGILPINSASESLSCAPDIVFRRCLPRAELLQPCPGLTITSDLCPHDHRDDHQSGRHDGNDGNRQNHDGMKGSHKDSIRNYSGMGNRDTHR